MNPALYTCNLIDENTNIEFIISNDSNDMGEEIIVKTPRSKARKRKSNQAIIPNSY